jgi:hypothetical protein
METRRIRRLEQRRLRRILVVMTSIGMLGLGLGLALPRSTPASALLLVVAVLSLVAITARADSVAPSHGLKGVIRLPTTAAISTSLESFRARVVGTTHAIRPIRPRAPQRSSGSANVVEHGPDEFVRPVDVNTMPDRAMS